MSNPSIVTHFDNPDPGATPLNLIQLVELLNALVSTQFQNPNSYTPYVISNGTPGVDDQDKAWLELDSTGRPTSIKIFWNGHWRRVYNGMIGEIRMYSGDPSIDFDGNGLGKVGLAYDGWHICNGKNGVVDLSDRFIVGAHMNNHDTNGYQTSLGGWISTVTKTAGLHQGGTKDITLTDKNTFQPTLDIGTLKLGKYQDAGNTMYLQGSEFAYGKPSVGDETKNVTVNIQSEGNPTPDAITTVPPYLAFAFIIFVGY
jgi:hypothetical protein